MDLDIHAYIQIIHFINDYMESEFALPKKIVTKDEWMRISFSRWALMELEERVYYESDRSPYKFSFGNLEIVDDFADMVSAFIFELEEFDIIDKCLNPRWPIATEALEGIIEKWEKERKYIYGYL